ncbi:unnamed protein product [Musa acuminata var. zebrina]
MPSKPTSVGVIASDLPVAIFVGVVEGDTAHREGLGLFGSSIKLTTLCW